MYWAKEMRFLIYIAGIVLIVVIAYLVDTIYVIGDVIYNTIADVTGIRVTVIGEPSFYIKTAMIVALIGLMIGLGVHIAHSLKGFERG